MQTLAYPRGLPRGKASRACNDNSARFVGILAGKLHEAGFEPVTDEWINRRSKYLIFNRGHDGKSNFYVFVRPKRRLGIFKGGSVEVMFTDPRTDAKALELKRNQIITRMKFSPKASETAAAACVKRIAAISEGKNEKEYYFHTHGHMGEIYNPNKNRWERIWDDGVSKDINCLMQAMFWNYDFFSLTSHNWCHNRLRLGWLNRMFSKAGMTFVPGCEITMPTKVRDEEGKILDMNLWQGPHVKVHFADMATALEIEEELLAEKIRQKTGRITPILCGPPVDIEEQLAFLKTYRDKGLLYASIAHPFSMLPGIYIFNPKAVADKGYDRIWGIALSDAVDGIEQYNCAESAHMELKFGAEEEKDLRNRLRDINYTGRMTSPILNKYFGEVGKAAGKFTEKGDDDHEVPPFGWISSYGWGYTKITMPDAAHKMLLKEARKPNSIEIVYSLSKRVFPNTGEKVLCEAVMFTKSNRKEPEIVDARKETASEKAINKVREWVPYCLNVGFNLARYGVARLVGRKAMGKEFQKEWEKAMAWNSEKSKMKAATKKLSLAERFKTLSLKVRAFRSKP